MKKITKKNLSPPSEKKAVQDLALKPAKSADVRGGPTAVEMPQGPPNIKI
jgi:hypothetical protein